YVFDRFRQADASMTRSVSGLGLGLALVHDLVGMHGGHVRAESAGTDRGARFTVTLPRATETRDVKPDVSTSAPPVPKARVGDPQERSRGVRVLLVDDDKDFVESLEVTLEDRGARVTSAASAQAALDVVKKAVPDVVVSDLGMPDEDGYTLIRELRARPPAE